MRFKTVGMLAAETLVAATLGACASGPDPAVSSFDTREPITITIGDWGNAGITEEAAGPSLESVYEDEHPWVDIVLVAMEYTAHHDLLFESLAEGEGASSVMLVDEGYVAEFVAQSDKLVNLIDLGAGQYEDDYLPWKWDQAATADGSAVIGLGYDVGGLALCYRKDLFEAAGLPSERDEVSSAVGDSWDDFIAFGREYVAATGKGFVENATNILDPAIWQLGTGHAYYDRDDHLDIDNIKPAFDIALEVIDAGLSSFAHNGGGPAMWSPEWKAGFTNANFAVTPCPSWMLGYIEQQVSAEPSFTGQWDVADIPGPGGNWGGSFYVIPEQGTEAMQMEAYHFVEWLVQPEQQLKIMAETGNLPSQTTILQSDEVAALTNPFFNYAPYGAIYAKSVLDIPGPVYHSRCEGAVRAAVESELNDLQYGNAVPVYPWDEATKRSIAADRCSDDAN